MKISSKIIVIGLLALPGLGWFAWTRYATAASIEQSALLTDQSMHLLKTMKHASDAVHKIKSGMQNFIYTGDPGSAAYINRLSPVLARQLEKASLLARGNVAQQRSIARLTTVTQHNSARQLQVIKACSDTPGRAISMETRQELRTGTDSITRLIAAITKKEQQLTLTRSEPGSAPHLYIREMAFGYTMIIALASLTVYARYRKSQEPALPNETLSGMHADDGPCTVMVTTDLLGRLTFVSNQVKLLTGYDQKELLHKDICFLATPSFTNLVSEHFKRQHLAKKPESKIYFPIFTKTGEQKWIEQLSVLKYEEGKVTGFQCIIKDISSESEEREAPDRTASAKRRRYVASHTSGTDSQWGVSKASWNLPML